MMGWLAALAGALGFALVYFSDHFAIQPAYGPYVSLAALAGMDALIGGVRARAEGKFRGPVMVSGFFFNIVAAGFLQVLGDRLNQPLTLAAVVALGGRIFVNLSIIRRHLFDDRYLIDKRASADREALPPLPHGDALGSN